MRINANLPALFTNKNLLRVENNMTKSMERLSSGFKLNHAKDNPSGMAISNKMRVQIEGLDRASENASDGIAAMRIADGALSEVSSIMQRIRELAVQAANDTNTVDDRQAIQDEIIKLRDEVSRISRDTEYNQMPILDGSLCARVYGDHVDRISTTDQVKAGIYKMTINKAATQAEFTSDTASKATVNGTAEFGVEGSLSVNGYTIEIKATDTSAEVYEKVREAAEIGGAEITSETDGRMTFTSDAFGRNASIQLRFSSEELAEQLGFTTGLEQDPKTEEWVYGTLRTDGLFDVPTGSDVEVELTKNSEDATSAFSDTATVRSEGNRLIITDKNGFEMSFLLETGYDATTATGEIELEVTDIGTMTLHIGANKDQNMLVSIPEVSSETLYLDDIDVTKMGGADRAIARMDEAMAMVSNVRSKIGSYENRLEYATASLDAFEENITGAQSRLTDTDMAAEMTTYTQMNVLNQAAISVLSQANDMPQQVLQLLQ